MTLLANLYEKGLGRKSDKVTKCNMDTCSGSCIQSGAMDFICLSFDYFALLDLMPGIV